MPIISKKAENPGGALIASGYFEDVLKKYAPKMLQEGLKIFPLPGPFNDVYVVNITDPRPLPEGTPRLGGTLRAYKLDRGEIYQAVELDDQRFEIRSDHSHPDLDKWYDN